MMHHPIPARIINSDRIPVAMIPAGGLFIDADSVLWMRLNTGMPGTAFVPSVAIERAWLHNFRDIDLVRPASGAFVGFVAGTTFKLINQEPT